MIEWQVLLKGTSVGVADRILNIGIKYVKKY